MLVTIFSDGSFNFLRKSGGWAVFVESERGKIERYGATPSFVHCSNHAELFAVYMGLALAYQEWGSDIHAFRVQSDSQCALKHVAKGPLRSTVRNRGMLRIRAKILNTYKRCGVQVLTEHVKGHQDPTLGLKFALNNKVDHMATRGRKTQDGPGFMDMEEVQRLWML